MASTAMINHDLSVYKTCQAPPPETLYWSNVRWRSWERSLRNNLIWVAFWALAIFYVRSSNLLMYIVISYAACAVLRPVPLSLASWESSNVCFEFVMRPCSYFESVKIL